MPFSSTAAAKKAKFPTTIGGASLTLVQINDLASIYDAIKKRAEVKEPMAVAISAFKKKYVLKNKKWTRRVGKGAGMSWPYNFVAPVSRIRSINDLPPKAQALYNDVYQVAMKRLKGKGSDVAIKGLARGQATIAVNRYWSYDKGSGKWRKKPK